MSSSKSMSGTKTMTKPQSVSSSRMMIFRGLTLAGAAGMLVAWVMPWWQAWIVELKTPAAVIHPWGLENFMPPEYSSWLIGADMPRGFGQLMWAFLAICLICLAGSMFGEDTPVQLGKLGSLLPKWMMRLPVPAWLIGGVGIAFIVCVLVCALVIQIRSAEFYGASLQGTINVAIDEHAKSDVTTGLVTGYWLAGAVGVFLFALSLLRNKILGKT